MVRKNLAHVGLALLFLGMFCTTSSAATLRVGHPNTSCPNAQYTTITAAVNAAAPGDVIEICPALYPEQLIITKPLILRGVLTNVNIEIYLPCCNEVKRVLLQPSLQDLQGLPFEAVITVMDTEDVTIENLAIDASHNTVASCDIGLSAVHFYNASGRLKNSAVFGAQLPNPQSCSTFFGNGFGVVVDSSETGPFDVEIEHNSIHDFQRDGIEVSNAGVNVEIEGNNISGLGPSTGIDQFGIFLNVVNAARITNNMIGNIDALDGIDMQGTSNSLVDGNIIFHLTPLENLSEGVFEAVGSGNNKISNNTVNDAYCGVAFVATSHVENGKYFNVLYPELLSNGQPGPPPTEP